MATSTVFFVSPSKDGWVVKKKGGKRPVSTHRLKPAAIKAGKRAAKRARNGQLKVQNRDRKIIATHNFG